MQIVKLGLELKTKTLLNRYAWQSPLKLNIGCGAGWHHEGWIGIDWVGTSRDGHRGFDINWDIRKGLPFRSNTVDVIFMSHVIEHFTYMESEWLLDEVYRVLKGGGLVRVATPDLDQYIARYLARDEQFFRDERSLGCEWLGNLTDNFVSLFYSAPACNGHWHKYAYSWESLEYHLKKHGFVNIRQSEYRKSSLPELNTDGFETFSPKVLSLYAEASK